ncbi:MAG: response regulator [Candidatus Doudnabacteria bacterium]|jgi:CheY-like chemotaxis protein
MGNIEKIVLIVEDDKELGKSLADKLASIDCRVLHAFDGEMAVELIVDERPSLILLDLMLPKLDGFKVLERLRNYPDKDLSVIKVVVLSNLWSDKDILRAKALKIEEYYVKSNTNLDDVATKVRQLMAEVK